MAKVVPVVCKPLHEHQPIKSNRLPLGCQRKDRARRIFPIERIHSRACTGICEQHKCRNEDNQPLWLKTRCCLLSPYSQTLLARVRCVQAGRSCCNSFRMNPPESNWLNLDNHGFAVSRRSIKNKMFCAHVISHESGLTTVSHNAVGRHEVLRCGLLGRLWNPRGRRPRRERGSRVPLVARNPVIRNSEANVSVYAQYPAESLDTKRLCCAPMFFVRTVWVRLHHNSRLFMTKDAAAGSRIAPTVIPKLPAIGRRQLHSYRPKLMPPYPIMAEGQFCASPCGDTKRRSVAGARTRN